MYSSSDISTVASFSLYLKIYRMIIKLEILRILLYGPTPSLFMSDYYGDAPLPTIAYCLLSIIYMIAYVICTTLLYHLLCFFYFFLCVFAILSYLSLLFCLICLCNPVLFFFYLALHSLAISVFTVFAIMYLLGLLS